MSKTVDDLTDEEAVELASEATKALLEWFELHENDIALGFEDYGKLKDSYLWFTGTSPRPTQVH